MHELLPSHPTLDRGLGQILEDIRRQLDVALAAVEVKDAVGRRSGLGVEGGGLNEQCDEEEAEGSGSDVAKRLGVR